MTDWTAEAEPVLEAVYKALRNKSAPARVTPAEVNGELSRSDGDDRTEQTLYDLKRTGYIDGMEVDNRPAPVFIELTEKGLQTVAGWPSATGESVYARLLNEIEQLAADASPEQRGRLEKLRDGLVAVGRDVFTNALSAALEGAVRGHM
jgi:DNA-binding PadR family transcriptional regulator